MGITMENLKSLYIIGILFFINFNCNGINLDSLENKKIINHLTVFYRSYIHENVKMPTNDYKINLIKKKYCTNKLLQKIELDDLDFDPLVNAQDYDLEWLKTLTIKEIITKKNTFSVSYIDNFSKKRIFLSVTVINESGSYKISFVKY
ncbi:MAG: DUF3828 domain-containing protein [Bacteroidetes bacterium]|nr:MAG: DUF3828 domain-containing protein [Bacteroidota bacterium]